jgi:UPF0271 protein
MVDKSIEIDINCDVGEGVGNEEDLFPYISSCNIACGAHAGDVDEMTRVVRLAKKNRLRIGAHPSYPDRPNFGRVSMQISEDELKKSIKDQVAALVTIVKKEGAVLHHIKAHGALYNDIAKDRKLARLFLESIDSYKEQVALFVPYGSILEEEAALNGFKLMREAFADRNYNNDLSLVSRKNIDALIEDPLLVLEHVVRMVTKKKVRTIQGDAMALIADTFCVHGDTSTALQILVYLNRELPNRNIYCNK